MRSKLTLWLTLVTLAFVPTLARAQDTTAKIHGHVQDPANAPIANAIVILSTDGKTAKFTFKADQNGDYNCSRHLLRHALLYARQSYRPL
jgi:hypothetical protein